METNSPNSRIKCSNELSVTMKLFPKLNLLAFLLAIGAGLLYSYVITPPPKIVIKFPTPENSGLVTYIDKASNCYQYTSKEVACPTDKTDLHKIPVQ